MGLLIQHELMKQGRIDLAHQVVVDTVPYTTFTADFHQYNGINKALQMSGKLP